MLICRLEGINIYLFIFVFKSETAQELMKQLLQNPNLLNAEAREKLLNELVQNIAGLDG